MAQTSAPQLTWANIVSTLAVSITLFGGFWVLVQNQIAAVSDKEDVRHQDLGRRDAEVTARITRMETEVGRRFVSQTEFKMFLARFDAITAQLRVLEATRPTTGELNGSINTIKERISDMDGRLRNRASRNELDTAIASLRREVDRLQALVERSPSSSRVEQQRSK